MMVKPLTLTVDSMVKYLTAADSLPVAVDQMGVDEMGVDKMGVDEMGVDKMGTHPFDSA